MIKTQRIGALRHAATHRASAKRTSRTSLQRKAPAIFPNVIQVPPSVESEYALMLERLVNGEPHHG